MSLLVIVSNISGFMGRHLRILARMEELFPWQDPASDAIHSTQVILILEASEGVDPQGAPRRTISSKPISVRMRVSADIHCLHLKLDTGPLGPYRKASISWNDLQLRQELRVKDTDVATLVAGPFLIWLPLHLVRPFFEQPEAAGEDSGPIIDVAYKEIHDAPEENRR
jgi:hypothetical protein